MFNTAFDLVYIFSSRINNTDPLFTFFVLYSFKYASPFSDSSAMKQNILLLSFFVINLTTLLHNLQLPSKRMIYFFAFLLSSAVRLSVKNKFRLATQTAALQYCLRFTPFSVFFRAVTWKYSPEFQVLRTKRVRVILISNFNRICNWNCQITGRNGLGYSL